MKTILHKAETRGFANHGWLKARHSFSFANYYDPERINFGVLRVLNDDVIAGGKGFGMHPHDNMEIITIPLEGALEHRDSMGNAEVISSGDVQVMSAGSGIVHSEYNKNADEDLKLLQIWVFPNKKDVEPRYDQISVRDVATENSFYQILSPNRNDQGVWIHQNAWFFLGDFKPKTETKYALRDKTNGVYLFVIDGEIVVDGKQLSKRDGLGIWDADSVQVQILSESRILLMELPLEIA